MSEVIESISDKRLESRLSPENQWILSLIIILINIIWFIKGDVAKGIIGSEGPMNSWLIPLIVGILAYISAFGYFRISTIDFFKEILPLLITIILVIFFTYNDALLPFIIGTSAASFMFILAIFNAARVATGPGGSPVVQMDYNKYVFYIAYMLTLLNGIINGLFYILEKKYKINPKTRWFLAFIFPLTILFIPAAKNMLDGKENGQYNVEDNNTFIRLYLSTRVGIYFVMYYLANYQLEKLIKKESII